MLELTWPYKRHAAVFGGTQHYAQEHGWESVIDEFADHTLMANPAKAPRYQGIIARATRKLAGRAARCGVPLVNVWFSSSAWKSLPGVFPDFSAAGRLIAEHLLARGFYRFASLVSEKDRAQALVRSTFAASVREAGYPHVTASVPLHAGLSLKNWLRTERTINGWMKNWEPPIAVYVGSESEGRMVIQMCRNLGWRVPDDVAIIAGWNEETFCEYLRPTLSSVEAGYERIGYEAARLLDRLMDGEPPPEEPILIPPQSLIVRESTDFFAVDDKLISAALAFIAANSHLPIGPEEVAAAVATSRRTLERHFIKHMERPIAAEIRRGRIERAKRELAQSERSIDDIARNCGFGRALQLYKVFVRELGITPSEYRRKTHT
jgi:LacI family transcriptional regulator